MRPMDENMPFIIRYQTYAEGPMIYFFLLPIPIALISGFVLGWLVADMRRRKALTGEEESLRREIRDLSREIQRANDEKDRKREISLQIPALVRGLSGRRNPASLPSIAVRIAKEFFRASRVGYLAAEEGEAEFLFVEGVGFPPEWKGRRRFPAGEGLLGEAVLNRVLVTKEDYLVGRAAKPTTASSIEQSLVGIDVIAPIVDYGRIRGVLVIAGCSLALSEERQYVSMLADLVANAYRNAVDVQAVEHSAAIDALTGVYNRACFSQRFEAEIRTAKNYLRPVSIAILDIDHFKTVNDVHGHPAGDVVLRAFVDIVKKHTRSSDLVARYGGEEFVLVLGAAKEQALTHVENLRLKVRETPFPIPSSGEPLRITFSAGIATHPEDGDSTSDLIAAADAALYEAKSTGRDKVVCAQSVGIDGKPLHKSV